MENLKKIGPYIVILGLIAIILFQEGCFSKKEKGDVLNINGKKYEVIKTIVEAAQDNENMAKCVLGCSIVNGAKEVYDAEVNINEVKPILESALYLVEQIENCRQQVKLAVNSGNDPIDYIRLENKYTESLKKCLNQI